VVDFPHSWFLVPGIFWQANPFLSNEETELFCPIHKCSSNILWILVVVQVVRQARLVTASVGELAISANSPTLGVAASKLDMYQMLCVQFELPIMGGKTAWNMYSTDSNKEYYITLHLVGYTWRKVMNIRHLSYMKLRHWTS
jgi:hypothetical protein